MGYPTATPLLEAPLLADAPANRMASAQRVHLRVVLFYRLAIYIFQAKHAPYKGKANAPLPLDARGATVAGRACGRLGRGVAAEHGQSCRCKTLRFFMISAQEVALLVNANRVKADQATYTVIFRSGLLSVAVRRVCATLYVAG